MDSPGFSAKYCLYTMMDHFLELFVNVEVVDKREAGGTSSLMEKMGCKRILERMVRIVKCWNTFLDVWHKSVKLTAKLSALVGKLCSNTKGKIRDELFINAAVENGIKSNPLQFILREIETQSDELVKTGVTETVLKGWKNEIIRAAQDEEASSSGASDNERAEYFRLSQEIKEAEALEQFSAISSHSISVLVGNSTFFKQANQLLEDLEKKKLRLATLRSKLLQDGVNKGLLESAGLRSLAESVAQTIRDKIVCSMSLIRRSYSQQRSKLRKKNDAEKKAAKEALANYNDIVVHCDSRSGYVPVAEESILSGNVAWDNSEVLILVQVMSPLTVLCQMTSRLLSSECEREEEDPYQPLSFSDESESVIQGPQEEPEISPDYVLKEKVQKDYMELQKCKDSSLKYQAVYEGARVIMDVEKIVPLFEGPSKKSCEEKKVLEQKLEAGVLKVRYFCKNGLHEV
ncbi:hypothetical protein ACROYT_G001266 [Oculina patagonica]